LLDFIEQKNILSKASGTFDTPANYDVSFIEKNSSKCDVIILCLGEKAYAEQPGVIKDLNLPEEQKALIRAAKKTRKPVVVILVEGRPRLFPEEAELTDAVLMCYRPGTNGGKAIVEILLGEINPSGILPFTYPKYNGDITTYDHKYKETEQQLIIGKSDTLAFNPQWEFGQGLSYTMFEFSNLKSDKIKFSKNDSVKVSVDVSNTGKRSGKVAVELYSRDHYASITPSQKRLRKYSKINLEPGEKKTVTFYLFPKDLEFVTNNLQPITEPGKFDLIIKNLKTELEYND
jgi:beta-glucosidase